MGPLPSTPSLLHPSEFCTLFLRKRSSSFPARTSFPSPNSAGLTWNNFDTDSDSLGAGPVVYISSRTTDDQLATTNHDKRITNPGTEKLRSILELCFRTFSEVSSIIVRRIMKARLCNAILVACQYTRPAPDVLMWGIVRKVSGPSLGCELLRGRFRRARSGNI